MVIEYSTGKKSEVKQITPEDLQFIYNYEFGTPTAAFVYKILDDKKNGSFIEVGSSHWKENSNTYVLEKHFGWEGIGLDIEQHFVNDYNNNRISKCIQADALNFNWDKYLEENNFPKQIDFLQIDVDDIIPFSNVLALINFPFSRYTFSVVAIEHIANIDSKYENSKNVQTEILKLHGYKLVASFFTDEWWIHESLGVAPSTYDQITAAAWHRTLGV